MTLKNWIFNPEKYTVKELKNILWLFRKGRKKALINLGFDIDDKDWHSSVEIAGANEEHRATFNH